MLHFLIHSSCDGHLGCFHILAILNNVTVNIVVHLSFWVSAFTFIGYIPRDGISGSYSVFLFIYLMSLHTVWNNIFKALGEIPSTDDFCFLVSEYIPHNWRQNKDLSDTQRLKEFITSRPTLQEIWDSLYDTR